MLVSAIVSIVEWFKWVPWKESLGEAGVCWCGVVWWYAMRGDDDA